MVLLLCDIQPFRQLPEIFVEANQNLPACGAGNGNYWIGSITVHHVPQADDVMFVRQKSIANGIRYILIREEWNDLLCACHYAAVLLLLYLNAAAISSGVRSGYSFSIWFELYPASENR